MIDITLINIQYNFEAIADDFIKQLIIARVIKIVYAYLAIKEQMVRKRNT